MAEGKRCCCGCCSVQTGTIIVGYCSLVNSVIKTGACILLLGDLPEEPSRNQFHGMVDGDTYSRSKSRSRGDDAYANLNRRKLWLIFGIVSLMLSLADVILSSFMLKGAINGGPRRHILPWFAYNCFMLVVAVVISILLVIYIADAPVSSDFRRISLIEFQIAIAVYVYLLNVVWQYMQELKVAERGQGAPGCDAAAVGFTNAADIPC